MKKKLLLLILSASLAAGMTACRKNSQPAAEADRTAESISAESEEMEEEKPEETVTASSSVLETETETEPEAAEEPEEYNFQEDTVTAQDCVMTFSDLVEDDTFGYTVKAQFENNSADITYMFAVEGAYANSLNAEPYFAVELAPGEKSDSEIILDQEAVEVLDHDISDIQLYVRVYNTNNYEEAVYKDKITLYTKESRTPAVYSRPSETTDQVLVDNEKVKVTFVKAYKDELLGYTMLLYLENRTTDAVAMYSVDDCSVNGVQIDPYWASTLYPEKTGYAKVSFAEEDFTDNGITEVNALSFTLRAQNDDPQSDETYAEETVTIQPELLKVTE